VRTATYGATGGTLVILTGASRGLGAALALALCRPGTHLATLSRHKHTKLDAHAAANGTVVQQHPADLTDAAETTRAIDRLFATLPRNADRYCLINNAGTVDPIGPSGTLRQDDIAQALALNVAAPMLLTSRFIAATAGLRADRRVLNISSGAGRKPMAGWSVYCSTKAAIDMYTRSVKLEQGDTGVRIVSLAPGVIDTPMQARIRASQPEAFPALDNFKAMHATGQLSSPDDVAARIVAYLERDDFGQTEIDDIRNY